MDRSREANGGEERRRERSEERGGGRPTSEGRHPQDRSRSDSVGRERGSSSSRGRDDFRSRDISGSREAERMPPGKGDSRDERGREWGRRGGESRERSSSSVSTKVEGGSGRGGENKEVWEAPMPGEWQPAEGSGVPSWDRTMLKEEENPPDWVEPPQPRVDLSLSPYKEEFDAEAPYPPVTHIENKVELLFAHDIHEDDPVVVVFARGYVRTTRRGLRESKKMREQEEREIEQMLEERGFFGGRGRGRGRGGRGRGGSQRGRGGDQGGFNPNMEPVAGNRGFGGSRDRRDSGQEGDRGSRERGFPAGGERSSRQEGRGHSRDGRSVDRSRDPRGESREVERGLNDNRRREERWPSEEERDNSRGVGGSSNEARRGDQGGRDGRGDFSGRAHGVKQEAGEGSGQSKPREAQSYKEWKEQQKKKSAGQ